MSFVRTQVNPADETVSEIQAGMPAKTPKISKVAARQRSKAPASKPHLASGQDVQTRDTLEDCGRRFEALFVKWVPLYLENERREREQMAGFTIPAIADETGDEAASLDNAPDTEPYPESDPRMEMLHAKMDPLARRIMELTATSMADLRAKVMVALYAGTEMWSRPIADLDYHEEASRRLIEAACALMGIAVPLPDGAEDAEAKAERSVQA